MISVVVLVSASEAVARPHCIPRPFRDGVTRLMCADDVQICMALRDGDECNGLVRSPECTMPAAMFCFAEYPAHGSSDIQCFAERDACTSVRTWVVDVESGEASRCARVTNGTPFYLYRRIEPRRASRRP